jgi:hypothetical protein
VNWCGPGSIAARPARKPSIHSAVGRVLMRVWIRLSPVGRAMGSSE